jgi:hemoglobin
MRLAIIQARPALTDSESFFPIFLLLLKITGLCPYLPASRCSSEESIAMVHITAIRRALLSVALLAAAALSIRAAPPEAPRAQSEQRMYDALRDVINRGADLYNGGDPNGCYRLFQGACLVIRAQAGGRGDVQSVIDEGMAEAERQNSLAARAFALRRVLDRVRANFKPQTASPGSSGPLPVIPGTRLAQEAPDARSGPSTLWDRLGGEDNVRRVVDDFINLAANDAEVDFNRGGRFKLDQAGVGRLKTALVDLISQASGGPFRYAGKSMKDAHKDMGITNGQFDAAVGDLRRALQKNGIKSADIQRFLDAVEPLRKEIVAPPPPAK